MHGRRGPADGPHLSGSFDSLLSTLEFSPSFAGFDSTYGRAVFAHDHMVTHNYATIHRICHSYLTFRLRRPRAEKASFDVRVRVLRWRRCDIPLGVNEIRAWFSIQTTKDAV